MMMVSILVWAVTVYTVGRFGHNFAVRHALASPMDPERFVGFP